MEAGRPSLTAQKVALHRLTFDRVAAEYGSPDADDMLARDVAATTSLDSDTALGDYLASRTLFFDRVVVNAIARGVTQAVIVGAGYDGRALRYAKPGVRWFEVDHPSTQMDKLARLARLGIDTSSVTYVSADFTVDDVAAGLTGRGLDASRATLFVCEGVTVYLERAVLVSLLQAIRLVAEADSTRFAISFSMKAADAEAARRQEWFRRRVAAVGEPERDRLDPEELTDVLAHTGWVVAETTSPRARRAGLVVLEPR